MMRPNAFRVTFTYTMEIMSTDEEKALDTAICQYNEDYRSAGISSEPITLFRCTKCGGDLVLQQKIEAERSFPIDAGTGIRCDPDEINCCQIINQTLECIDCREIFNYLEDDNGNILGFNDDDF